VKRSNKQYFIYYLKENILLFDVFDYIEELAADYVDYCHEWNVVKDNFVKDNPKIVKFFLNDNLNLLQEKILKYKKEINCDVLFFYKEKPNFNLWCSFFKEPSIFIKKSKKILKSKISNFIEINDSNLNLFERVKGTYEGIPCLLPSGEDEDFILQNIRIVK
jgi:hypothetical protein